MGFLTGYNKRKAIKYNTVFPGSNLTDFPKLFKITTDADIASELSSNNGIAVTLANGTTTVPFGLYPTTDGNVGTLLLRAQFSPLTAASTGDVMGYLYYDHTQTTSEDKAGTVANGYALFMPLEEDPSGSAPQMFDWVTETNLGTSAGSMTSGDLVAGQVGNGLDFDGSNDYIDVPGSLVTQYTLECIFNLTDNSGLIETIDSSNTGIHDRELYVDGGPLKLYHFDGATKIASSSTNISGSTTYYGAGRYDGTDLQVFLNGAANGSAVAAGNPYPTYTTPHWRIGVASGNVLFAHGVLDEVRVSSVARSADWLAYAYADDFTNSDTFTLGSQETAHLDFDAASNSGYHSSTSLYSWDHTCSGSNRFLAVDVALLSVGSTISSVAYNGNALTLIVERQTVTALGRIACYGIIAPDAGTHTITVTLSGSAAISAGLAVSYVGVDQTTPTEGADSNQATNVGAADATVDITTSTDQDWIHAALATSDGDVTANQTPRNEVNGAGGSGADEDEANLSPSTWTVSYTDVGALATWAIAAYGLRNVQPPPPPPSSAPGRQLLLLQAVFTASTY